MNKIFLISIILLLISACGRGDVATVNGRSISSEEFEAYLKHKRIAVRNDEHRKKLIEEYAGREAMMDLIESSDYGDDPVLQAELRELKKEILISRYMDKFLNEHVTDQVVTDFYNANAANYEERKVHVAHILVRTSSNMDEASRKMKLTTLQEAHAKIKKGSSFETVAEKYSEDAVSGKKGGDLGWIKEGGIDKAFSDKAFSLKKDEISEPFETAFGFHIIKVIEEPTVIKRPFDAVKGEIRYQLRNQTRNSEIERMTAETRIKIK